RKDGSEYLETLHIKKIHVNHCEKPYYIGIITDITLKKEHEASLAHTEKMTSIATLVGGIAHNFNNLLSGIIGNAYLAQDERNPMKTNERLQLIERISFDASDMVKSLLIFARNHAPKKKNIAIIPLLKQVIETAKLNLPDDVELSVKLPDEPLMLYCDTAEIQQAMLHLISNASDALPEQGKRAIRIQVQISDWQECCNQQKYGSCSAHVLKITIQDTGCGISEENLPHIFDPFFSTKEVGKGTGLGLSTTFSTVQAHGGSIHVHNIEPVGCSFDICFPLTLSSKPHPISELSSIKSATSTTTILIVDDEMMVRNTLQQILESLGYQTICASQGQEAIDIAKQHHIDLVISDIVMPIINGISSVNIMRQNQPKLPAIFITGYDHQYDQAPEDKQTLRISKPFDIRVLSQKIADLLSSQSL
ncbi:MAG: response regulator, partial [Mariprofundaceae bacterium]|nr:response regulator [Mariprofundaceae bacterium]